MSLAIVRKYISLVEALTDDEAALRALLADSFTFTEFPNAISPQGQTRDLNACIQGIKKARMILISQTITIERHVETPRCVVTELTWKGTLKTGPSLTAHCCMIFDIEGEKIARQRTYDCYEPLPK